MGGRRGRWRKEPWREEGRVGAAGEGDGRGVGEASGDPRKGEGRGDRAKGEPEEGRDQVVGAKPPRARPQEER